MAYGYHCKISGLLHILYFLLNFVILCLKKKKSNHISSLLPEKQVSEMH